MSGWRSTGDQVPAAAMQQPGQQQQDWHEHQRRQQRAAFGRILGDLGVDLVVVEEEQEFPHGLLRPRLTRRTDASIVLAQPAHGRITRREARPHVLRGAVIDDDDFQILMGL